MPADPRDRGATLTPSRSGSRRAARHHHRHARRSRRVILIAGAAVSLGVAVAAAPAFTRPATSAHQLHYEQTGRLSYSAPVGSSSVYGRSGLTSGKPVYTSVVRDLRLSFDYQLLAPGASRVSGTEHLAVTIGNGQGIVRTIGLQPPTRFTGDHVVARAVLPVRSLERLAADFESVVGAQLQSNPYAVTVRPSVRVSGMLGHRHMTASLHPTIAFTLDGGVLSLNSSSSSLSTGAGALGVPASSPQPASSLSSSSTGMVRIAGHPTTYLFRWLAVPRARLVGLAALALFLLLGALAIGSAVRAVQRRDERARIASRHRATLVAVEQLPSGPAIPVVDVGSFQGLIRLARRLECPVLSETGPSNSAYGVVDNGTVYRYEPRPTRAAWAASAFSVADGAASHEGAVVRELARASYRDRS